MTTLFHFEFVHFLLTQANGCSGSGSGSGRDVATTTTTMTTMTTTMSSTDQLLAPDVDKLHLLHEQPRIDSYRFSMANLEGKTLFCFALFLYFKFFNQINNWC